MPLGGFNRIPMPPPQWVDKPPKTRPFFENRSVRQAGVPVGVCALLKGTMLGDLTRFGCTAS